MRSPSRESSGSPVKSSRNSSVKINEDVAIDDLLRISVSGLPDSLERKFIKKLNEINEAQISFSLTYRTDNISRILESLIEREKAELAINFIDRIVLSEQESEAIYHAKLFEAANCYQKDRENGENCVSFKVIKHMIEKGFDPGCYSEKDIDALRVVSESIIEKLTNESGIIESGDIEILSAILYSGKISGYIEKYRWERPERSYEHQIEKICDLYNKIREPYLNPQLDLGLFLAKYCEKKDYEDRDTKSPIISPVKLKESFLKNYLEKTKPYQDDTLDNSNTRNDTPSKSPQRNQFSFYSQLCRSLLTCFGRNQS